MSSKRTRKELHDAIGVARGGANRGQRMEFAAGTESTKVSCGDRLLLLVRTKEELESFVQAGSWLLLSGQHYVNTRGAVAV